MYHRQLHLHQHSVLHQHHQQGHHPLLNCCSHNLLWTHCRDGAESMTCLCAIAPWTVTVKRPDAWSLSWRLHPMALGAFYDRGMTLQEVQFPQSYVRLCRTATYGLCWSLRTTYRMSGACIWCTRLWQRHLCPIGLFPCFRTCPALSILRNWSSTTTLTWALILTALIVASVGLCSNVSYGNITSVWFYLQVFKCYVTLSIKSVF